jgi:hypothetical protein
MASKKIQVIDKKIYRILIDVERLVLCQRHQGEPLC